MLLDHVIILVPYKYLASPPQWLTSNFTLSPGGQHSDGKTENRLVLFRDGTYLELIAFINDDPDKRAGHWWDKPYGVIDYAFTTKEPRLDHEALNDQLANAQTSASYAKSQAGSRLRPDGVELNGRDRRVPITKGSTTHPCGAIGIGGVIVKVEQNRLDAVDSSLKAITGSGLQYDEQCQFGVPSAVGQAGLPSIMLKGSDSGSASTLALSLVIHTPGSMPAKSIQQEIEGGTISIMFEQ